MSVTPIRPQPKPIAGRVPPNDLDSERAVLSAALFDRRACDAALDALAVEHFYSPAHGRIFECLQALRAKGATPDIVSLANLLRVRDQLTVVGGAQYLAELADATPAVANVLDHAKIVRAKWKQRSLIAACHALASEGYGDVGDVDEWMDRAEVTIHAVTSERASEEATPTLRDTLLEVFADLSAPQRDPGVATGLTDLDALMGPLLPGQLIVVAANSGVGKTSLATQVAMCVATTAAPPDVTQAVLLFSAEMSRAEIATRILFGAAEVNAAKARRTNWLTPDEWTRLSDAAGQVALRNVYFDDRPGLSPRKIRSKARAVDRQSRREGFALRLIVVDYLQLIDGSDGSPERREREIAAVSLALKTLAKELEVPVVVLAQLNEDARREKRPPRKEDLRECKSAGHDADKVVLIHNPHADERRAARRSGEQVAATLAHEVVDLIVDKNRGGPEGKVSVRFYPSFTAFGDAMPEDLQSFATAAPREAPRRRPIEHQTWQQGADG